MKLIAPRRVGTAVALACFALAGSAQADDTFKISGFGTLGYTKTNRDDAAFHMPEQPYGETKSGGIRPDSKLAVQLQATFSPMFSATVQAMDKYDGKGSETPKIEWAFLKAQFTPSVNARVGRIGVPAFAVSDFRDVNYANVWLRPPLDVYGQVPFSHFDGADVTYSDSVGPGVLMLSGFAGKSSTHFQETPARLDNAMGFNATYDMEGLVFRLGHVRGKLSADNKNVNTLLAGLRAAGLTGVANELAPDHKPASFTGLGVSYDRGDWVLSGELTKRRNEMYVPDTTGWYLSAAYRWDKFTPYVVVSSLKVDDVNVNNTVPAAGPALPLYLGVKAVLNSQNYAQDTTSLGLRWDAYRNIAVKFQYDRVRPKNGPGMFYFPVTLPTNRVDGTVNVFAMSVDFVF